MGRPKLPPGESRTNTLRIRLTEAERARIDALAARSGQEPSAWARTILLAVPPGKPGKRGSAPPGGR